MIVSAESQPVVSSYREHFQSAERRRSGAGGPPWLAELRREAMAAFEARGWPGAREEAWLFTSLKALERTSFRPPEASGPTGFALPAPSFVGPAPVRVVLVDGRFDPDLSAPGDGVRAVSLARAVAEAPETMRTLLGSGAPLGRTPFVALNTAFLEDGVFLDIAAGQEAPLVHVVIASGGGDTPRVAHPRVLVVARSGARVMVVEEVLGPSGSVYFTNAVTEVVVEDNASVEHVKIQRESEEAFHVGFFSARLGRAARLVSHSVSLGARLARHDLDVFLGGDGAECDLLGLYAVSGRQHVDHHTRIDHVSPHTLSREHYKGVLDGKATGVFNGRVIIRPGAQKVESTQTNNNLLLSLDALVHTNPELEILADDIQARHGATIGQLDPDQLFYLRSRGIDVEEARRVLIRGFAGDMVDRIRVESLAGALRGYLEQRF